MKLKLTALIAVMLLSGLGMSAASTTFPFSSNASPSAIGGAAPCAMA